MPIMADVTDLAALSSEIAGVDPSAIVHCAAYTGVDAAETDEATAYRVNVLGTEHVCRAFAGRVVHLSTDFVFDGKDGPYSEEAMPHPSGVYGATKWVSEWTIARRRNGLTVRTTILYGWGRKPNFVTTVLAALRRGETVRAPGNLWGTPTYALDLALALYALAGRGDVTGVLNLVGRAVVTRYDLARLVARTWGLPENVEATQAVGFRPKLAGLTTDKADGLGIRLRGPLDGLAHMKETEHALEGMAAG